MHFPINLGKLLVYMDLPVKVGVTLGFFGGRLSALPDGRRAARSIAMFAALVLVCAVAQLKGAAPIPQLQPATRQAFEKYVRLTDERNEAELKQGTDLLWVDGLKESERVQAYAALRQGEVKLKKLETTKNGAAIDCPSGLIHHWVGVLFIRGVKLDEALAVLQDYDHHATYYAPDVERSNILLRDGGRFRVFLRFRRHKVITVVLDTEHEVRYFRDAPDREHSRSSAIRIAEVEHAGKSDEREKPSGDDGGYMWGMETWWRMLERDGGVYVQSEVASLTRDIPAGLGWLVGLFVNSIPRETLTFTLDATRKAALVRRAAPAGNR